MKDQKIQRGDAESAEKYMEEMNAESPEHEKVGRHELTGRRIVRVPVASPLLVEMLTKGWSSGPGIIKCIDGLPVDAKFVNSVFDPLSDHAYFFFEHESFEIVQPWEFPPFFLPTFAREYPEAGTVLLVKESFDE
jgi:hypothetical protein